MDSAGAAGSGAGGFDVDGFGAESACAESGGAALGLASGAVMGGVVVRVGLGEGQGVVRAPRASSPAREPPRSAAKFPDAGTTLELGATAGRDGVAAAGAPGRTLATGAAVTAQTAAIEAPAATLAQAAARRAERCWAGAFGAKTRSGPGARPALTRSVDCVMSGMDDTRTP